MATTSKKTTKLFIPHPHAESCSVAGVLEQLAPEEPTQGRKIALVRTQSSRPKLNTIPYCPCRSSMAVWGDYSLSYYGQGMMSSHIYTDTRITCSRNGLPSSCLLTPSVLISGKPRIYSLILLSLLTMLIRVYSEGITKRPDLGD